MVKRIFLACSLSLAWVACQIWPAAADPAPAPRQLTTPPIATGGPSNSIQLMWMVYISGIKLGLVGLKSNFGANAYSSASMLKK